MLPGLIVLTWRRSPNGSSDWELYTAQIGQVCFHSACVFTALQQNLWVKGPWKKALRGKVQSRDFPTALGNPATAGISTFPTTPATTVNFPISPQKENS